MIRRVTTSDGRRGAVAVKVAMCLPAMIGVVALALDGSMLFDNKRKSQSAADAAAMAAAGDLFTTYTNTVTTDDGKDVSGTIATHAKAVSATNGYTDATNGTVVTVNIPPTSGQYTGKLAYAEVIITSVQKRGFSSIFSSGDLPVAARAVARGQHAAFGDGILVLDPVGDSALKINGNGGGVVPNSPVVVNSNHTSATVASGANPILTAMAFQLSGGYSLQNPGNLVGPISTGVTPTPDPFRYIPEPDKSTMTARSKNTATVVNTGGGAKTYYLQPGVYNKGLSFSGQESVVMAPGIYYMDGGGFKFSGSSDVSLTATEVMVFNGGSKTSDAVTITGSATVNWTPPMSGTYQGLTFFQARGHTAPAKIAGGAGMDIGGAFYFPDAALDITGGGGAIIGDQVITYQLTMGGNGTFYTPYRAKNLPRIRYYNLTE